MTRELGRDKKWQRTNGQNPCPLCHKSKGCLIAHDGVICLRVPSAKEVLKGLGGYYHPLHSEHPLPSTPVVLIPGSQRKAEPVTLDRVYQHLLDQHQLSPEDLLHLTQVRRLHRDAIDHRKYRSWGQFGSMRSKIARLTLQHFGSVALDVPGIIVRKQMGERPEYVTLAGASGIAIPIRDVADRISGIQLRIQNPKPGCGKPTLGAGLLPNYYRFNSPFGNSRQPIVFSTVKRDLECYLDPELSRVSKFFPRWTLGWDLGDRMGECPRAQSRPGTSS